mmetsp:Transcript_37445/g.67408  ORF Transcript_37445/g.67408 Transcript_37445/m.67408 type:complete len:275 (-) Transcript_37445:86-910(-)
MMSAFSHLLVRRTLPSSCTQKCNQYRLMATKAQQKASKKQARSDKLRNEAKNRKVTVGKSKKPTKSSASPPSKQGSGKNNPSKSSPPPPPHKNVPKAPHMQLNSLPKKDGWKEYLIKNPLIFAGFIFPTVVTGMLVLAKPNLRAQVFGGGDDGGGSSNAGVNASKETAVPAYESLKAQVFGGGTDAGVSAPKETPVPAYETDGGSLKKEDAKNIVSEEGTAVNNEEGTTISQGSHDVEDAGAPAAVGFHSEIEKKEGPTIADLIHAIGFRPHRS